MNTSCFPKSTRFRPLTTILVGIVFVLVLSSCSSQRYASSTLDKAMMGGPGMKGMGAPGMKGDMGGMPGMPGSPSAEPPMAASPTSSSISLLVIKTADLTVEVPNIDASVNKAIFTVKSAGGFVESSSYNRSVEDKHPTASLILRVPSMTFENVLGRIGDIGKTVSKSVSGEDVTEQVFDIEARLRNKRAEEAQYVEIMQKAKRIPDIISVSNELFRVREEIEKLQGRVKYLRSSADMSTISLTFTKPSEPSEPGIANSFKHAWKSLIHTSISFTAALIWVLVYSPFWLGVFVVVWLVRRKLASMRSSSSRKDTSNTG